MKRKIIGVVGFLGFVVALGAIGGCENETMPISQCALYSCIGLIVMVLSIIETQRKRPTRWSERNRSRTLDISHINSISGLKRFVNKQI